MEVADFLDSALLQSTGKVFVNCVFGRSRQVEGPKALPHRLNGEYREKVQALDIPISQSPLEQIL